MTDVSYCEAAMEVNTTVAAPQSHLGEALPHLDSDPLIAQDRRVLNESQAAGKELVVEVLVHSGLGVCKEMNDA